MLDLLAASAWDGLASGCLIGLVAVGYSMAYGLARVVNFAHGELFTLAGYFALLLAGSPTPAEQHAAVAIVTVVGGLSAISMTWDRGAKVAGRAGALWGVVSAVLAAVVFRGGLPWWLVVGITVGLSSCVGMAIEFVAYRPLARADRLSPLVAAVGLSQCLVALMQGVFSPKSRFFPSSLTNPLSHLLPLPGALDTLVVTVTVVITAGAWIVARRSRAGIELRAVADDAVLAARLGINTARSARAAFGVGGALAGVAVILQVTRAHVLAPTMGYSYGILAFSAAVLGGIGNLGGALAGGILIGLVLSLLPMLAVIVEQWTGVSLSDQAALPRWLPVLDPSAWGLTLVYLAMAGVLVLRPRGILGERTWRTA